MTLARNFPLKSGCGIEKWRWIALFLLISCPLGAAPLEAGEDPNGTSSAIATMDHTMRACAQQATGIRDRLSEMLNQLTAEIRQECHNRNITALPQGLQVPRIRYNLELVRDLHAYLGVLDEKISYLKDGLVKLTFHSRQLQDDMQVLCAVNSTAADTLTQRIDQTLAEYDAVTSGPFIDARDRVLESLEKTWERCL